MLQAHLSEIFLLQTTPLICTNHPLHSALWCPAYVVYIRSTHSSYTPGAFSTVAGTDTMVMLNGVVVGVVVGAPVVGVGVGAGAPIGHPMLTAYAPSSLAHPSITRLYVVPPVSAAVSTLRVVHGPQSSHSAISVRRSAERTRSHVSYALPQESNVYTPSTGAWNP